VKAKFCVLFFSALLFSTFTYGAEVINSPADVMPSPSASPAPVSVAPSSSANSSGKHFGLGFASVYTAGGDSTMLTAWVPLKRALGIQLYLGVPGTLGGLNFLTGAAFKGTIAGNSVAAIHLGVNLLLGSINQSFTMGFGGLVGAHFTVAPSVLFAVDGGPQIGVNNGKANFSLGALSSLLGASLMYLF